MKHDHCIVCGKPLPEDRDARVKYCGQKCRNESNWQRFKEKNRMQDHALDWAWLLTRKGLA